jgi:hypothetical protein
LRIPSDVAPAIARIASRRALGLVDLLLLLGLRSLDDLLLLALGRVDRGVALPFRGQDDGALLALGPHLLLHRGEHVLRRRDVLDFVAEHLDAPRLRGLVELVHDLQVDVGPFLERPVEIDLPDLAAEVRLGELRDREQVVGHPVRRALGVHHLEVEDSVDADLDVVARDADLLRDVDRALLEGMLVADDVEEGEQDVESRPSVPANFPSRSTT